eukprot:Clim_evm62s88 gene=Clim_evmTU62s88
MGSCFSKKNAEKADLVAASMTAPAPVPANMTAEAPVKPTTNGTVNVEHANSNGSAKPALDPLDRPQSSVHAVRNEMRSMSTKNRDAIRGKSPRQTSPRIEEDEKDNWAVAGMTEKPNDLVLKVSEVWDEVASMSVIEEGTWKQLVMLDSGSEFVESVVKQLVDLVNVKSPEMQKNLEEKNYEEYGANAHYCRGMCASVGLNKLQRLCKFMQSVGEKTKEDDAEGVRACEQAYDLFKKEYDATMGVVNRRIEKLKAK